MCQWPPTASWNFHLHYRHLSGHFLFESWLRQRGDKATCSDLTPVGYFVCSFPHPSHDGGIAISLFPFHHQSFEAARISLTLTPTLCIVCVFTDPRPVGRTNSLMQCFMMNFLTLLNFCNNLSGKCIILGNMIVHFDSPKNPWTAKLVSWAWSYF